jgi:hypothetical protein
VAVFGAVLAARTSSELSARLPASARGSFGAGGVDAIANSPERIRALPADVQEAVVGALASAIHSVFLWAIPLLAVGFVLAWFLREIPLKDTAHAGSGGTLSH